jgi:hypothetical protein
MRQRRPGADRISIAAAHDIVATMRLLFAVGFLGLAGCSASPGAGNTGTSSDGGSGGATSSGGAGGSGGSGGATSTGGGGEGGLGGFGGQGGQGGATPGETEVFGHSANTLYRLDPVTKEITVVGDFQGCSGVIDIAIDKDGAMAATAANGLYKIDKATAACTEVAVGGYPNSLSFVPAGTVDPDVEALVGFDGSTYMRIYLDGPKAGQKETIGTLDGGYISSGDVVSVIGGGTYLTVFGGPESCGDCIIQVDPKTGAFIKNVGSLGHSGVFGLAFWGGSAYGFDSYGELFQIDLTNGMATVIAQPNAPADLSYYGAGSSTAAPLDPPE